MTTDHRYGQTLPDQVERIADLTAAQIDLLGDIRETFRERAALEKEYAGKLQALSKKAWDKKNKKAPSLVVGDEPTKPWNEDTLRRSTLDGAYTKLLTGLDNEAQDHLNLSEGITSQIVEVLKEVEHKYDDAKKKQMAFFQKIVADRDKIYAERVKNKQKYDEECLEVESHRQKQERASDDRHANRAAKHLEQQQADMFNSKNTYIISTAVANMTKAKFYNENLPALEDQFQTLQTGLITKLVAIVRNAEELHVAHLDAVRARIDSVQGSLDQVDPVQDQALFVDYNIRPFSAPPDWSFEPCSSYYDTPDINIQTAPKVLLQNKLARCRSKLQDLLPLIDAKGREVEKLSTLISSSSLASNELDEFLEAHHQLTLLSTSETALNVEIETISAAIGDDEGAQQPHTFKSSTFSIPTPCAYCKTSIWGLNKQGKVCKSCGISVHHKCELKIPADCAKSRDVSRASTTVSRVDSRATAQTPTASSFAQPHASVITEETHVNVRVLFDFTPTSPFELAVSDGEIVRLLDHDDGSGWVKVQNSQGGKGLVPASYVGSDLDADAASEVSNVDSAEGSKEYVRGIYAYDAKGEDELDVVEGELIELTSGGAGGKNYAGGWWEGIDGSGRKGIFPSNYVESL